MEIAYRSDIFALLPCKHRMEQPQPLPENLYSGSVSGVTKDLATLSFFDKSSEKFERNALKPKPLVI